jgi:FixJ family two-component response regulator
MIIVRVKMDVKERESGNVDFSDHPQDETQLQTLVNTIMKFVAV